TGEAGVIEAACSKSGECGSLVDTGSVSVESSGPFAGQGVAFADAGETMVLDGSLLGDEQQSFHALGDGLIEINGDQAFAGTIDAHRLRAGSSSSIDSASAVYATDLQVSGPDSFTVPLYGASYYDLTDPGLENLSGDTTW